MKDQDEGTRGRRRARAGDLGSASDENVTRAEGEGEADEPDTPTAEEENPGMNTILDAEPLFGVQDDASEE